jgi:hypothetical protein
LRFRFVRWRGAGCRYKSLPDTLNRDHPAGLNMTYAAGPPNKKPLRFPVPHDAVTTRLLSWIRGSIQSYHEFVDAFLRFSYKALLAGTSGRDAEPILWQVEFARREAERSKTALALD